MENTEQQESYSLSNADAQQTYVGVRRAKDWIGFLLPHLKSGFDMLDCGCGVGSITLDLAEIVAPGKVIGVDMDEKQLQVARSNAEKRGLGNVFFEQGNIYELRFDHASFDVVVAHTLLYHLSDPLRAMRELRRMLRPGGILAISDDDLSTMRFSPDHPLARKIMDIMTRVLVFNGASPYYSPHLRSLLLQAGFARTEGFAVAADHYGRLEETRRMAYVMSQQLGDPGLIQLVTSQGWATKEDMDEMIAWVKEWGERPDAFMAVMYCAALGWNE
jgi:ubiquinone/menaquinone biosynthesis C-methylase UbiE